MNSYSHTVKGTFRRNKDVVVGVFLLLLSHSSFGQSAGQWVDDRDGKVYKTVTIGESTWFAENLAFETPKGSWVYDKDLNNVAIYGRLYNWKTALNVCPSGWRLPGIEDYKALLASLGTADSLLMHDALMAGGSSGMEMKFAGWYAGRRYGQLEEHGDFWTSTTHQPFKGATKTGVRFSLYKRDRMVYWGPDFSDYAFSVRCIKR